MQTQLLPLVNVAKGWGVEMVLVDDKIEVENTRLLKVDADAPSNATPRSARSGRGRAPARHTPVASQRRRS